jgi:rubrerythrin
MSSKKKQPKKQLVCLVCGKPWRSKGSPNYCPACKHDSAAIVVEA